MLSDYERRTLGKIQSDLAASDPELARSFDFGEPPASPRSLRRTHLLWVIAASAAFLSMLSLAIGLAAGAFLFGTITLVAMACELWWPPAGLRDLKSRVWNR